MPYLHYLGLLALILIATGQPQLVFACQISGNQSELENAIDDRNEMRRLVKELEGSADTIFIGDLKSYRGTEVTFDDIVIIKGNTSMSEVFTIEEDEEIVIGCGGLSEFENVVIDRPGKYRREAAYLIYAKDQKIIRVNSVETFVQSLSGYEEIEWLTE